MDFLSRFLMINTLALGVALALLAWNWRKTCSEVSPHNRVQPPKPHEFTSPGEIEKRAKKAMSDAKMFVSLGEVSNEEKESLKIHQGAFYAHFYAANVYRSQDSQDTFNAYMNELNLAEEELAAIETVLKDHHLSPKSPSLAHSHS